MSAPHVLQKYARNFELDPETATLLQIREKLNLFPAEGLVSRADIRKEIYRQLAGDPGAAFFSIPYLEET
jgi:hypothetical protein